jgi:hypothetical protein
LEEKYGFSDVNAHMGAFHQTRRPASHSHAVAPTMLGVVAAVAAVVVAVAEVGGARWWQNQAL